MTPTRQPVDFTLHTWVIFCRVVDHFGDAGFCLRLAKALIQLNVPRVILVIDRVDVLLQLEGDRGDKQRGVLAVHHDNPQHQPAFDQITWIEAKGEIMVLPWQAAQARWEQQGVPADEKADVLIEAFACDPPEAYLSHLKDKTRWLTLDYLATEPWAGDAHLKRSPCPRQKTIAAQHRRWFIPGFSHSSGGLLHGQWQHLSARHRRMMRNKICGHAINDDVFLVMAFGYADAPWQILEQLLQQHLPPGFHHYRIWRPQGIDVSQQTFDQILQACDLNFVRGEDSFVRAHWSAAGPWQIPFIWQPYRQENGAHAKKMAAWFDHGFASPQLLAWKKFHWAWNQLNDPSNAAPVNHASALSYDVTGQDVELINKSVSETLMEMSWRSLCQTWPKMQRALHQATEQLALQTSLEANLIQAVSLEPG